MITILNATLALIALFGSASATNWCPPIEVYQQAEDTTTKPAQPMVFPHGFDPPPVNEEQAVVQQAAIDVVFVLDTTGSMGGLIEGAKQKVWSIANQIAMADPRPVVRMGLVGYRDRGDEYVTRITALTDDIDTVYADLMAYQAKGGGDTPESVNEALFQAVERFDWTTQDGALKLIYLVGDAPPKMEYTDDVKYQASCRIAIENGININTIQCGNLGGTQAFWQEISQLANGAYAAIEHNGGVVAISTPYDEQLARLDAGIHLTMLDYGDDGIRAYQYSKRERSVGIAASAAPEAAADRALYNSTAAGYVNAIGKQELVNDVVNGVVSIEDVEQEQLPEELRSMTIEELKAEIERRKIRRENLSKEIKELAGKRAEYLKAHQPKGAKDGFDQRVLYALIEQGARVGIKFKAESEPNSEPDSMQDTKTDTDSDTEPSKETPED